MGEIRARWLAFYADHIEPASKEIFSHVEKMIIGTLIVSAGAHVSSNEPAIIFSKIGRASCRERVYGLV